DVRQREIHAVITGGVPGVDVAGIAVEADLGIKQRLRRPVRRGRDGTVVEVDGACLDVAVPLGGGVLRDVREVVARDRFQAAGGRRGAGTFLVDDGGQREADGVSHVLRVGGAGERATTI